MTAAATSPALRGAGYPAPDQLYAAIADWRAQLAHGLRRATPEHQRLAACVYCMQNGGEWTPPGPNRHARMSLMGIATEGETLEDCLDAWIKCAIRSASQTEEEAP